VPPIRSRGGHHECHGTAPPPEHHGDYGFEFAGVNHLDHTTGQLDRWEPGPHYRAGEVVFAPRGTDEGDGWLLCFAYDRTRDASDFVVLDAMDVASGPVAHIKLPGRVPHGFHGWWLADA
jgi:carotenoid cleavage dioxygenase-like enzyme